MTRHRTATSIALSPMRWITHTAYVLALVVMIARLTTPDVLRDPWGSTTSGPGAATGLVFDLLASVPALLVLMRRAIDREFTIRFRGSHLLLFCLAIWAVSSTAWSSDRFAAAVTSSHFLAASCLLWAMSQLVRSSIRFRLVAAISLGLLLVLVAQSVIYRFVDVPENISYFNEHKAEILKQRDWTPDSFSAIQFERKITSGELVGFFNSANSFAAVGVLLFAACVGIGFQKVKDGEKREWLAMPFVAVFSLIWILINARSKTSAATPFLGAAVLCIFVLFRHRLRGHHLKSYWSAVGFITLAMIAVIGHGLYHHGLFPGHFSNSLDFRWKYWVASAGVFAAHPLIGVGWGNFGLHYLAHRLPEAAEEIKDPHNFLIRFFVELGAIGGALSIAWLLRLGWEITKPSPEVELVEDDIVTVKSVVIIVLMGMLLSIVANYDFSLPSLDLLALLMKPLLFTLALMLGTIAGSMRSPQKWSLDGRPAGWIFFCTLVGLGLFLLHNLIDFSLFEAGIMATFMVLVGSALGVKHFDEKPRQSRWLAIIGAIAAILGWLAVAGFFVTPIVLAEQFASNASQLVSTAPDASADENFSHYHQAAVDLSKAAALVPYNADYVFRQAQAVLSTSNFPAAEVLLRQTKQINPLLLDAYLLDANVHLAATSPDQSAVRADFNTVLRLNPNDVSLHVQYGKALERFGADADARGQYKMALAANAALPAGEPKRLSADQVLKLQAAANSKE